MDIFISLKSFAVSSNLLIFSFKINGIGSHVAFPCVNDQWIFMEGNLSNVLYLNLQRLITAAQSSGKSCMAMAKAKVPTHQNKGFARLLVCLV